MALRRISTVQFQIAAVIYALSHPFADRAIVLGPILHKMSAEVMQTVYQIIISQASLGSCCGQLEASCKMLGASMRI